MTRMAKMDATSSNSNAEMLDQAFQAKLIATHCRTSLAQTQFGRNNSSASQHHQRGYAGALQSLIFLNPKHNPISPKHSAAAHRWRSVRRILPSLASWLRSICALGRSRFTATSWSLLPLRSRSLQMSTAGPSAHAAQASRY